VWSLFDTLLRRTRFWSSHVSLQIRNPSSVPFMRGTRLVIAVSVFLNLMGFTVIAPDIFRS
jgi:hypothetical protein